MKLNQNGAVVTVVALVVVLILLIASLAFGFWAFSGRQKYKNDTQQLINSAVSKAQQKQQSIDNARFFIEAQNPLIKYVGPEAYGTITLYYPKNWSSYVNTSGSSYPVDGYFFPGTLPSVTDNGQINFALRLQVENQSYATILQNYDALQASHLVNVTAYSLPKLPNVVGVEISGQVENSIQGTMVILPLRSEALEVWTEGSQYMSEFNNDILANLSFSP